MPPHLSDAVKWLIVGWRFDDSLPVTEIAHRARCSSTTVYEVLRCYREYGTVNNPLVRERGRRRLFEMEDLAYVKAFVRDHPAAFLDEVQDYVSDSLGLDVSLATLSRTLRRLAISNKAIAKTALERDELVRAMWEAEWGELDKNDIVWLDESSVDDITNQRIRGWAEIGRPCVRRETFIRGQRYSILPALSVDGIVALDIFEGSVTKERFIEFLQSQLVKLCFHISRDTC